MSVSIDNLGENVTNAKEARHSAQLYHQILDAIVANQLNANISLKLTHMGVDVDEQLAREIVIGLVAKTASMNRRDLCASTWRDRPTPSALLISSMNCTACREMRTQSAP